MAAVLRRAVLAIGVLGARAVAFVPGGVVRAPHVQLPPAVSARPSGLALASSGGLAGARPSPRGPARVPMMAVVPPQAGPGSQTEPGMTVPQAGPGPESERFALRLQGLVHVPVRASEVVDLWAKRAVVARAEAIMGNDDKTRQAMTDTQAALEFMGRTMSTKNPSECVVFGLTTNNSSIQAIASLTIRDAEGEWLEQEDIDAFAVKPDGHEPKVMATELIHNVVDWAASTGRKITISQPEESRAYYQSLGLKPEDLSNPRVPYWEAMMVPDRKQFRMVTLDY